MDYIILIAATIFAGICGLGGMAALIYGLKLVITQLRHCTLATTGLVVDMVYDDLHNSDPESTTVLCAPRLQVELDGVEKEVFNEQYTTEYRRYRKGDIIPIRINPANPNEYVIADGKSPARFLVLLGLGMIFVCFAIIWYFWL